MNYCNALSTRWFNLWPSYPQTLEVTWPLKGSINHPKKGHKVLPGRCFQSCLISLKGLLQKCFEGIWEMKTQGDVELKSRWWYQGFFNVYLIYFSNGLKPPTGLASFQLKFDITVASVSMFTGAICGASKEGCEPLDTGTKICGMFLVPWWDRSFPISRPLLVWLRRFFMGSTMGFIAIKPDHRWLCICFSKHRFLQQI